MSAAKAWRLPWTLADVPHAVLDIMRGCNIRCRACYNSRATTIKPLAAIAEDLKFLFGNRSLSSVTVLGGEPLLHPELPAIIRLLRDHGLEAGLCTNGVALNDDRLRELRQAGTDFIFLHVESGQERPDLSPDASLAELRALRTTLVERVAAHGLVPAITMTARRDSLDEVIDFVRLACEHPALHFALVTLERDLSDAAPVRGSLAAGLRSDSPRAFRPDRRDTLTNVEMTALMQEHFGFQPFAYIGSNIDLEDPRWLSYLVMAGRGRDGALSTRPITASGFERAYIALRRRLAGRYRMHQLQTRSQLRIQLLLNGLTGGGLGANLRFLGRTWRPTAGLQAKRILFQCLADILPDGRVVHCSACPDAVVQFGGLVPVCMCDKVVAGSGSRQTQPPCPPADD